MRVLITGHLGFIGAVMVPLVQKAGHEVTGLDIGLYDGCDFGPPAAPIREIRTDLRDVDGSLLKGFDAVIHLAALSNDPLGDLDAQLGSGLGDLSGDALDDVAVDRLVRRGGGEGLARELEDDPLPGGLVGHQPPMMT